MNNNISDIIAAAAAANGSVENEHRTEIYNRNREKENNKTRKNVEFKLRHEANANGPNQTRFVYSAHSIIFNGTFDFSLTSFTCSLERARL